MLANRVSEGKQNFSALTLMGADFQHACGCRGASVHWNPTIPPTPLAVNDDCSLKKISVRPTSTYNFDIVFLPRAS